MALFITFAIGFTIYVNDYYQGTQNAINAINSNTNVTVEEKKDYVSFVSEEGLKKGIIFFQGGKVDHIAYAPYMQDFAKEGYVSILIISPFRLAMFGLNSARKAINAFPEIEEWIVIGHSLGGVFGSNFVAKNNNKINNMVFLASYPVSDFYVLSTRVLLITASEDKILDKKGFDKAFAKLNPDLTSYLEITGGNHGQFGDYGAQSGDGIATISQEEQRMLVVNSIINWLNE